MNLRAAAHTTDLEHARQLDVDDPLAHMRDEFVLPRHDDAEEIYLVGNSLGAMPKRARAYVEAELARWSELGVRGHFTGEFSWAGCHDLLSAPMGRLVGAGPDEVTVMNSLTVNLHLLMVSFYRPTSQRHKILIEEHAFPSDHFAVESQIRQRGFDPASSLVTVSPRPGEHILTHADIIAAIDEHGPELALVLLPGVQYYTGQVLDMETITAAGQAAGAAVGFDLAHAVGNIVMHLHDWNVDFAAWCTYKYLNSGPGGVGACFVHERHINDQSLPKLLGWWGTNPDTRFEMATTFDPIPTVESWQVSNGAVLPLAALRGSLEVFDAAGGITALRAKAERQVSYLDFMLCEVIGDRVVTLTPAAMEERGCQFALQVVSPDHDGRAVFEGLEAAGVGCDWRYPDVIRVAPVPLYTRFEDIHRFTTILDALLS